MDLLLDSNNDLQIKDGDLVVGESELQEAFLILKTNKGEWKEDPVTGCSLLRFINSKSSPAEIRKQIQLQLTRDGKSYDKYIQNMLVNGSDIN